MSEPAPLTPAEERAIRTLKRLATVWPESLWLFSANGRLCVMKKDAAGDRAVFERWNGENFNQAFIMAVIEIENDGGDW